MTLKKMFSAWFVLLFPLAIFAQNNMVNTNFWRQLRYGGGISLDFFNGGFNTSIAPTALYPVSNTFQTGASLNFNYAKVNDNKLLAYGGSLITLYNPVPFLQLSGELEQLRINRSYATLADTIEDNYWSPALFLGAGYSTRNLTLGLRYNLLYDDNRSIYSNALLPFVRIYF